MSSIDISKASVSLIDQQCGRPLPLYWDGPFLQSLIYESKHFKFKPRRSRFRQLLDDIVQYGEDSAWRGRKVITDLVTHKYPEAAPLYWPTFETELERLLEGMSQCSSISDL